MRRNKLRLHPTRSSSFLPVLLLFRWCLLLILQLLILFFAVAPSSMSTGTTTISSSSSSSSSSGAAWAWAFVGISTVASSARCRRHRHRHLAEGLLLPTTTTAFSRLVVRSSSSSSSASSSSSSSAPTPTPALQYLSKVKEGMVEMGFDVEVWESCGSLLASKTGLPVEEAEDALAKAWNWKSWAVTTSKIARRYIRPKEPSLSVVEDALDWLEGGPMELVSEEQLSRAILSDPVSYLVDPSTSYQKALTAAPPEYQDEGDFNILLAKEPDALKNYANCKTDGCNSDCGNCWVSFKLRGDI